MPNTRYISNLFRFPSVGDLYGSMTLEGITSNQRTSKATAFHPKSKDPAGEPWG